MKLEINASKESVENMIEFLESSTDECYTPDIPYPPSKEYSEFLEALKCAYKNLTPLSKRIII